MEPRRRAFYEYHAAMMEPWTGRQRWSSPMAGRSATLDRNGLGRRYVVTDDGLVVMASESGVLSIAEAASSRSGGCSEQDVPDRLRAGPDRRRRGAQEPVRVKPYRQWVDGVRINSRTCPPRPGLDSGETCSTGSRPSATPGRHQVPDEPDGPGRRGRHRLDGQRSPWPCSPTRQAALQLLQAAVRAGHEPADRSDPRGDRDRWCRSSAPSPICSTSTRSTRRCGSKSRSRSSTSPTWRDCARSRTDLRQVQATSSTSPIRSPGAPRWRPSSPRCAPRAST